MLAWQVKWANDFSVPVLESQEEEADEEGGRQGGGVQRTDGMGGVGSAVHFQLQRGVEVPICAALV